MDCTYHKSWNPILEPILELDYMIELFNFIADQRSIYEVYPEEQLVFNAFKLTPFDELKVVILGQDPYHNVGQAHGLSFSVPDGVAFPPSLRNIFTELTADISGFQIPGSGDLSSWAKQGVLLLNATLTVRAHQAGSHQKRGWEKFTDEVIKQISALHEHVVFILWGAYAQKKIKLIDTAKHFIIQSAHPSPLSVYRGFYGSKPFSKSNAYLESQGKKGIDWRL